VEQLFLDLPIQHVLDNNEGMQGLEPWATLYVNAIGDKRFGDAIWARYNIAGNLEGDIKENTKQSVLDVIKEDALNYRVTAPEEYAKALSLYAETSRADGRTDVLGMVSPAVANPIRKGKRKQPEGMHLGRGNLSEVWRV
jgi:hypothetical protein